MPVGMVAKDPPAPPAMELLLGRLREVSNQLAGTIDRAGSALNRLAGQEIRDKVPVGGDIQPPPQKASSLQQLSGEIDTLNMLSNSLAREVDRLEKVA